MPRRAETHTRNGRKYSIFSAQEKTRRSCRFTWTIENFSKLTVKKLYSDVFYAGGYIWRVLIFPTGNNVDYLSMYLDAADSATLPNGWSREAQFSLSIINQIKRDDSIKKETQHVFNVSESDWGFTSFIPLSELNCSARGYILHDTCIVEAEVKLCGLDEEELKTKDEAEARLDTVVKPVEAQQEQFKPPDSEHGIRDAQVTELHPISVNVPPEQSIPLAKNEEQSEKEPVLEKTRVQTQTEHDPSSNSFHCNENPGAHSTVVESEEVETLKMEKTQEESKMDMTQSVPLVDQPGAVPPEEPTVKEADTSPSSFAELDILFSDIQNLLEGKSTGFQPPRFTNAEIANAKETFEECLNMNLANVIKLGRASEFKNSLSIMLTVDAFPSDMLRETTKFLANFDRNRETYVSAQQDLREAKEKQNSVSELKAILKELSLEFVPTRNRANEVDQEVAKLERQLAERKEEKAQLKNSLEDLAGRASTSRLALINAEQEMKLFMPKKEQAEEMIRDIDRLWESLKKETCF